MSLKYKYIMIHHSLTKDGKVVDIQAIRKYHTSFRIDGEIVSERDYIKRMDSGDGILFQPPWSEEGYNYFIEFVNDEPEVIVGRPLHKPGAHCKGEMNRIAIGICFVGNYDKTRPKNGMLSVAAHRLIAPLCKEFNIPLDGIIGHRKVANHKTCPGLMFNIDELKAFVSVEL